MSLVYYNENFDAKCIESETHLKYLELRR